MIDILLNISKVKYVIMDELFKDIKIENDTVNLFIDMHTINTRLFKESTNPEIVNNDDDVITYVTGVLNLVAHYRRYLFKRLGKSNRIFLIQNTKTPIFNSREMAYGNKFFDKYSVVNKDYSSVAKIIKDSSSHIKEMIQYIEDAYYVETPGVEDTGVIKYLMEKYNDGFNIVLSKYELLYQMVSCDNTIVLRPNREKSSIITRDNIFESVLEDRKYTPQNVNYKLFPIYLSFVGIKCRDIPSVNTRGTVQFIKLLDMMIDKNIISNNVSINSFISKMAYINSMNEEALSETIMPRYNAIYFESSFLALTQGNKMTIDSCLIDLYDQNSLEKLNDHLKLENSLSINDLALNKFKRAMEW